MYTFYSHHK